MKSKRAARPAPTVTIRPTPFIVKAMTFPEMIASTNKQAEEARKFVQETGLCLSCKKNKANLDSGRCSSCEDEIDKLLKELEGPGFMAFRPGRK